MKFGESLLGAMNPLWEDYYIDYDGLKNLIKELGKRSLPTVVIDEKLTSLTVAPSSNAAGQPATLRSESYRGQEKFYKVLEENMRKIEDFTLKKIEEIRESLEDIEGKIETYASQSESVQESLRTQVKSAGEEFLELERYVNLNFTGFHKILKKHDRFLPNPCKQFYLCRLRDQAWVRGDYSDVIVRISQIYSTMRGDEELEANDNEKQDFVRSTTKYWVRTEDITAVKMEVTNHLPVLLQPTMGKNDAQLVNSVYLDNYNMELYRGRLEKTKGAIALRMRWYHTALPSTVFVERKTHRESWAGELSVKERFIVSEDQVMDIVNGTFDKDKEISKMRGKGKKEEDIRNWDELATEVLQAINSKQLIPTMRTQYMRTAFQIDGDPTVRVSLDTNLCMISERVKETLSGKSWFRDPNKDVPLNQITRFPHAVLEVKLQLKGDDQPPSWVTNLINSGRLHEVHKFSKFIHGCAVLMTDDVHDVPYWVDDASLEESIRASDGDKLLASRPKDVAPIDIIGGRKFKVNVPGKQVRPNPSTATDRQSGGSLGEPEHDKKADSNEDDEDKHPVKTRNRGGVIKDPFKRHVPPFDPNGQEKCQDYDSDDPEDDRDSGCCPYCRGISCSFNDCTSTVCDVDADGYSGLPTCHVGQCCDFGKDVMASDMSVQKIEPKLIFANERTFVKWMNMAVVIGSISTGILAFSDSEGVAQYFALMLLPIALVFIIYAQWTFRWRCNKIKTRDPTRWDDPCGPVVLTVLLTFALILQFTLYLINYFSSNPEYE